MCQIIPFSSPASSNTLRFLLVPILFFIASCSPTEPHSKRTDCTEIRAAFDVGSSTTKLTVAEVNTCENTIRDVLLTEERDVAYSEALETPDENGAPRLPDRIVNRGRQVLSGLKQKAGAYDPDAYSGVATSAFREAANGKRAVKSLSQEVGVPLRVISQKTEARLGLVGARRHVDTSDGRVAVWDIGAGSMQLTVRRPDGDLRYFRSSVASVSFKRSVIAMQGGDPDRVESPNPLGHPVAIFAFSYAQTFAEQNVPSSIQSILQRMDGPVVGIGGVHVYSIRPQVAGEDAETYSRPGVVDALIQRALMTDDEIGGEYASTEVTNLALVGGMMTGLQIDQIRVVSVSLTDGLLLADDFW